MKVRDLVVGEDKQVRTVNPYGRNKIPIGLGVTKERSESNKKKKAHQKHTGTATQNRGNESRRNRAGLTLGWCFGRNII